MYWPPNHRFFRCRSAHSTSQGSHVLTRWRRRMKRATSMPKQTAGRNTSWSPSYRQAMNRVSRRSSARPVLDHDKQSRGQDSVVVASQLRLKPTPSILFAENHGVRVRRFPVRKIRSCLHVRCWGSIADSRFGRSNATVPPRISEGRANEGDSVSWICRGCEFRFELQATPSKALNFSAGRGWCLKGHFLENLVRRCFFEAR